MKKWISILFLSAYLLTATEFNELFKLPLLVEHFIKHNEGNMHVSFWQFIYNHYTITALEDADNADDMKLPFKSQSHFEKNNTIHSICFDLSIKTNNLSSLLIKKFIIISEIPNNNSSINTIWQPPKFS